MISFVIPLEPVPAARPKMTRSKRVYYPPKYSKFKGAAKALMPGIMFGAGVHTPVSGRVAVGVEIVATRPRTTVLPEPKPDLDNYVKAVLDACNGFLFEDDCQVSRFLSCTSKRWTKAGEQGHIKVKMKRIT